MLFGKPHNSLSNQTAVHRHRSGSRSRGTQLVRRLSLESLERRALLATIVVTSLTDDLLGNLAGDGQISLREAVEAANNDTSVDGSVAGNGADTIIFHPSLSGGTIELAGMQLDITDDLAITGLGAEQLTIRGKGDSFTAGRVLSIDASATVDLSGLTISHGAAVPDGGGSIFNQGTLTITDSVFDDNVAYRGGAIANEGTLVLHGSTIKNGLALDGAAVWNTGSVDVTNSDFQSNRSYGDGGAIWNNNVLSVSGSTFVQKQGRRHL